MEEANLTETILGQDASPVAGSCDLDVFCCRSAKINSIVLVTSDSGRLSKLSYASQCRPIGAVGRILNRNIFDPETDKRLYRLIRVPYPHLVQFVSLAELILDPGPQRFHAAKPHIPLICRVQVVIIQSRAVDGIFRTHFCLACTGSRDGYVLDGIRKLLGHKTPDFAFIYRIFWCDLIDAPVVSRGQTNILGRGISGVTLGDTANAVFDVVEVLTKVNFVPIDWRRIFSRRPAKDQISRHICLAIIRVGDHSIFTRPFYMQHRLAP